MISFVVAFALLLHVAVWGAGLAVLIMPRPWRRFWPVLVFPVGFVLQSVVVWLGTYAGLHGTDRYAWVSELIPVGLLVLVIGRRGVRRCWTDLGRFGLVAIAVGGTLVALVLPLAIASRGLTSTSLGSCDAADYAAGARVLMKFAHADRSGFLGLTEVVRVMSVDNFYDFWLRLNHFTPSALMAFNGSILGCAPHEIASLVTMVVLAGTVPIVFWMARAVFGYSAAASLAIASLFGLSPIPWYSVAQVSPAPLLAAEAIALLNWAGIALWKYRLNWRRGAQFAGLLVVAYALVLGAYNFILLVSLVPALVYAGWGTVQTGAWRRFARWLVIMLVPLGLASALFWARVAGMVERFLLFRRYDFGWRIPVLSPEGWLGMVQGGDLQPWAWGGLRWGLGLVVVAAFAFALVRGMRRQPRRVRLIASVTLPVLAGYAYLEFRGAELGTNASYDAFKLFTVFYPLLLPAFCWWITLRWTVRLIEWFAVAGMAFGVLAFNALGCVMFIVQLSRPPLLVTGELRQVRKIETMADVASVNMLIPDMWSRLWANEFLLRKAQYFPTHTYEGRLNTPLRGDWDLRGGILHVDLGDVATRSITPHYSLVDTRDSRFLRPALGSGWYPEERLPNGELWQWSRDDATVEVDNPHDYPLSLEVRVDGRGTGPGSLAIALAGTDPHEYRQIDGQRRQTVLPPVRIPPGRSTLVLHEHLTSRQPPTDTRPLALCVFSLTIRPQR